MFEWLYHGRDVHRCYQRVNCVYCYLRELVACLCLFFRFRLGEYD